MHRIFRVKAYEMEHGPHFNEEHARKAVMKMENEDGTRGPHWSIEETTTLASQYGISLTGKYNRYDWYVALNMVYSDYYRVIMNITGSNNTKHYVEFAKAWLNDKDIDEGKMWYYYIYVMCDKIREAEMECYEEELEKHEGEEEPLGLTISTDKQEIVGIIKNQYNTYKVRKESIAKCDEEMSKCQALLEKLDIPKEPINTEDSRIKELQDEINELKNIIKQASSMVPPPMKQMLPQNMQNVMKEVDQ